MVFEELPPLQFFLPPVYCPICILWVHFGPSSIIGTVHHVGLVETSHHTKNHIHQICIDTCSKHIYLIKKVFGTLDRNPLVASLYVLIRYQYKSRRVLHYERFRLSKWVQNEPTNCKLNSRLVTRGKTLEGRRLRFLIDYSLA